MKWPKKQSRRRPTARQTLGAKAEETETAGAVQLPDAKGSPSGAKSSSAGADPPPKRRAAKSAGTSGRKPVAKAPKRAPDDQAKRKPAERPKRRPASDAANRRGSRPAKRGSGRSQPRRGAGAAKAGAGLISALRQGTTETRKRSRGLPTRIGRTLNAGLVAFFGIFFDVVAFIFNVGLAVAALVAGPGRALLARLVAFVALVSRLLTPARALALVVAGGAVLLALSQFADYRGVSVGTDAYSDVSQVAPAPEIDRREAGEPHSYLLIPVALASLVLLAMAMRGRWRLCRLIALGGAAAIVVGLLVDRPAGLDPGDAAQAYQGVEASLLGGFYAQLFAGLLLAASALLLGRELKLAAEAGPEPARERRRAPRKLLRRRTRAEGARA